MGPYFMIWRCHRRALALSVAATRDRSQYKTRPTMRRNPTGTAASACTGAGQNIHNRIWRSSARAIHQSDSGCIVRGSAVRIWRHCKRLSNQILDAFFTVSLLSHWCCH